KDVRAIREQRREIGVLDARLEKPEPAARKQAAQVALLHRPRIVVGEAVDPDDLDAVGDEPFGKRRADEPGNAGNQCLHENSVRTRAGSRQGLPLRSSVACTVVPVASVTASAVRTTS